MIDETLKNKPVRSRKIWVDALLALIVILLAAGIFYQYRRYLTVRNAAINTSTPATSVGDSHADQVAAIDGVYADASKVHRPFAVVVENHPDARPQSGLSQADVVYEALAEGGITRFLAIYQTQDVSNIGPVRSARTYFVDWADQLGAIFVHVGGNSDALTELSAGVPNLDNADQFFDDSYFRRVSTRVAPHNVYTSTDELTALATAHNFSLSKSYSDLNFKDDAPASAPTASKILINFSTSSYAVSYTYDSASNSYLRSIAGNPDIDVANNRRIEPKVVIVQYLPNYPVQSDTVGAIGMDTRVRGVAHVYQDGSVTIGTWQYLNGRTRYFDKTGNEISLNRGVEWIEIVPPANSVSSS